MWLRYVTFSILLATGVSHGQLPVQRTFYTTDTIAVSRLLGNWVAPGTTFSSVRFYLAAGSLKLVAGEQLTYDFFLRDSLFVNGLRGTRIKWPPDDCHVLFINPSLLEISFSNFSGDSLTYRYRRR